MEKGCFCHERRVRTKDHLQSTPLEKSHQHIQLGEEKNLHRFIPGSPFSSIVKTCLPLLQFVLQFASSRSADVSNEMKSINYSLAPREALLTDFGFFLESSICMVPTVIKIIPLTLLISTNVTHIFNLVNCLLENTLSMLGSSLLSLQWLELLRKPRCVPIVQHGNDSF